MDRTNSINWTIRASFRWGTLTIFKQIYQVIQWHYFRVTLTWQTKTRATIVRSITLVPLKTDRCSRNLQSSTPSRNMGSKGQSNPTTKSPRLATPHSRPWPKILSQSVRWEAQLLQSCSLRLLFWSKMWIHLLTSSSWYNLSMIIISQYPFKTSTAQLLKMLLKTCLERSMKLKVNHGP